VIKDYQYKKFDECEDADERKKKVDKNTEALKWALYDSVSRLCAVLIFLC